MLLDFQRKIETWTNYPLMLCHRFGAICVSARHVSECRECRSCQSVLWPLHFYHICKWLPPSSLPLHRMCQWNTSRTPQPDVLWHPASNATSLHDMWEQGKSHRNWFVRQYTTHLNIWGVLSSILTSLSTHVLWTDSYNLYNNENFFFESVMSLQ